MNFVNNNATNYTDFDRISDTLMYLDNRFSLSFVTRLSSKDKNNNRKFYEYQIEYNSDRYVGIDKGYSIKRQMYFYYIIENKESFNSSMILRINDVYILNNIIKSTCLPWYFGATRIYSEVDNRLVITGKFDPVPYIQDEQHWLRFEPIVIGFEDGTFKEGCRICINNTADFVDLALDRFIEFLSLLNYQMMYTQSMCQCLYNKMSPYDSNMLVMGGGLGSGSFKSNQEIRSENKYGLSRSMDNKRRSYGKDIETKDENS